MIRTFRTLRTLCTVGSAAWLALCASVGPSLAQSAPSPGVWMTDFGQGIQEAMVRNGQGGEFRFACPLSTNAVQPSITLTIPSSASEEPVSALVRYVVDGREFTFPAQRTGYPDERKASYDTAASTPEAAVVYNRLIAALRRGKTFTAVVVSDRVQHRFGLTGSGRALAECVID